MSYFCNGRISRDKVTNNSRQIHGPECALGLTIVYLNRAIECRIDIEISQLSMTCDIKVQSQDLRRRWISRIKFLIIYCIFHFIIQMNKLALSDTYPYFAKLEYAIMKK